MKQNIYYERCMLKMKRMCQENIHGVLLARMNYDGRRFLDKVLSQYISTILLISVLLINFFLILFDFLVLFGYSPDDVLSFINTSNPNKLSASKELQQESAQNLNHLFLQYFRKNQDFYC